MARRWFQVTAAGRLGLAVVAAVGLFAPSVPSVVAQDRPSGGAGIGGSGTGGRPAARTFNTPWGEPDLQGIWNNNSMTPLERPGSQGANRFLSDEESESRDEEALARANRDRRDGVGSDVDVSRAYNDFWWEYGKSDGRPSLITDPPDGRIPALTAAAKARLDGQNAARNRPAETWLDRSTYERCITRGIPVMPGAYNNNFQIVQSPGVVTITIEMIHESRIIPLDGRPHLSGGVRQWLGDSRGHWEGSTLVIETTNFSDKTSFRGSSDAMRLVERLTRVDEHTIKYDFTVEDPGTWARPWTASIQWSTPSLGIRGAKFDAMYEYACHEGNYGLYGILAGARAQERGGGGAARKGSR
ncbi:MAG: hypothetical protein EXQ48_06065 [Acidobacteria bacterium]|nr:hypothetical protein [Acidobacteriota bacterium]